MRDDDESGLSRYIERVRRIPLLSREEEHEVALRAAAGDERAREQLIRANLRFVVAVALQHRRPGLRLADLIAEGNVGLVTAARKFDPSRGTRFVTYAGFWIRAAILDLVVRGSAFIGAGSGPMRTKMFFRLRRERARVAEQIADPAERNAVLAERFAMTEKKMARLLGHLDARVVSLDAPVAGDATTTLLDTIESHGVDPEAAVLESVGRERSHGRLYEALERLDPRERFVVEQRFFADEEASLADVGRSLGVSRERARQLEARAKSKLREALADLAPAHAA